MQSEEILVGRIRRREEQALEDLVRDYGGLLNSIVSKHMYQLVEDQDDCMNDVLLAIWDHIEYFDPAKNSFKNWVAAIAKYTSLNYVKKYSKHGGHVTLEAAQITTADSVMNGLIQDDFISEVEKLFECLKAKDRTLFRAIYLKEQSIEEICTETGLGRAYIYNRLSRGKKKLRALWKKGDVSNG